MSQGLLLGILTGLASAVLFGVGAVAQAHGVRQLRPRPWGLRAFVRVAATSPLLLLVVALYLAGFALHAVSIWFVPLYLAQSLVSFSLPVTVLCVRLLGERVQARTWWSVLAVIVGLLLLVQGSGAAGLPVTSWALPLALIAALAALFSVSLAARRLDGRSLGWLAGLGYAGSAISVRGVGWPVEASSVVAALLVPLWGLLAFWLYSIALERDDVTSSTAPLITAQTLVPALVGLVLLGDGVREGWWPAVLAGSALALWGATTAGRADTAG